MAYTMQIYYDFSGYSDMAVGLGLFCGFSFPINFNSPYKSICLTDFWRRWHITLSTWLRDYLYIPLGGSRHGSQKTYRNLTLTMLLGGLWHGASWNFVIWGALHGTYLAAERAIGLKNPIFKTPLWMQSFITFLIVSMTWVFFRAETLPKALAFQIALFSGTSKTELLQMIPNWKMGLIGLSVGLLIAFFAPNTWQISQRSNWPKTLYLALLFVVSIVFLFGSTTHPFLYFQF
jgi:alginate O-acetyltransferase complex protein AlgI